MSAIGSESKASSDSEEDGLTARSVIKAFKNASKSRAMSKSSSNSNRQQGSKN